jgi:hypothetical protein
LWTYQRGAEMTETAFWGLLILLIGLWLMFVYPLILNRLHGIRMSQSLRVNAMLPHYHPHPSEAAMERSIPNC